ncbi:RNA polymerase sigma factor [uncultured Caudovirales phage]|uniref:RNA polymerase sigma factor n=1 Tax=uncultured Caudovirales phage TaxID=2100421 RepID=A0A6J5KXI9_9CAUD|nr:RNA polymerase sigma factor [uncultured Caudovirales phage]
MSKETQPKRQYVDNAEFFIAMQERIKLVKECQEQRIPIPRISEYIGNCIFKIATNFAHLRSFNGYIFKDDMILDGVENCLKVIDNFDENKTHNPFSYFTQIIYFAFLRRIAKEKKQVYIRSKLLTSNMLDLTELQAHDEQGDFTNHYIEYMKAFNNFDGSSFEKPKKEKIKKEVVSPLEDFYG